MSIWLWIGIGVLGWCICIAFALGILKGGHMIRETEKRLEENLKKGS